MFENVFADRQVAYGGDEALGLSFSDEECQEMLAEWVLTSIEKLFFSYFVDDLRLGGLLRGPIQTIDGYSEDLECTKRNRYVFILRYVTVKLRRQNDSLICSNF